MNARSTPLHATLSASLLRASRRARLRYSLAVAAVALLAMFSYVGLQRVILAEESSSTVINVAARQARLSQQAALLSSVLVAAETPAVRARARRALEEVVERMARSHNALVHGDPELGLPPPDPEQVQAIYFDPERHLDLQVVVFLAHLRALLGLEPGELKHDIVHLPRIMQAAQGKLLRALDHAAAEYERAAKRQVAQLHWLETLVLFATLLTLLLEVRLIFRPMTEEIRSSARELLRSHRRLDRLAHFDPLTGLANRLTFQRRLAEALASAREPNEMVAVLILDLDHFKDINDTLGHPAGDHLLKTMAERLNGLAREQDTVARLGGDEFALILEGLGGAGDAEAIADRIVARLAEPVSYRGKQLHSGGSVGIALGPRDGDAPEALLRHADLALYRAKAGGRGSYHFFCGQLRVELERRKSIKDELRRALANDEFTLVYQPQMRVEGGRLEAVEALLRWVHPERGQISPDAFMPAAEESGLIVPIGTWVLTRALRDLASLRAEGLPVERVAVNLAALQFRTGDLVRQIRTALAEAGLEPAALELELTEGMVLDRGSEKVLRTLRDLHRFGVNLALDDFGTGAASLSHLRSVPFDRLKIDQSFVRDLEKDPDDAAIVRAVIQLAQTLGGGVIAEGVETAGHLAYLEEHGCDLAQGYLFSRPLPAPDLVAWWQEREAEPVAATVTGRPLRVLAG